MKNLIILIVLCGSTLSMLAQGNSHQLFVKKTADAHQLRWFPVDYQAWAAGLEQGYRIERSTNGRNFTPLHTTLIKPSFSSTHEAAQLLQNVLAFKDSLQILREQNDQSRKVINSLPREFQRLIAVAKTGVQESGLIFADKSAQASQQYWYQLQLADGTVLATVRPSEISTQTDVPQLEVTQSGESIQVQWLQERGASSFQTFQLERRIGNGAFAVAGADWQFPRAYPEEWNIQIDTFRHIDTISVIGDKFTYRLRAIDAFGTELAGKLSEIITKDMIPPASATILTTKVGRKTSTVSLRWEYLIADPDLHAFAVYRSLDPDKNFERITPRSLAPQQRAFQDQLNNASGNYYYKIAALDQSGNISWSHRANAYFPDKTPPAIPTGLVAQHDTLGQVSLSWKANSEADVKGYVLTRGRFLDDEFVALTANAAEGNTFHDTVPLHFINRSVFYKVAVADRNGNVSAYSEPVELILPDTIAPVAPALKSITQANGRMQLSWQAGNEEDLVSIKVFRKRSAESSWRLLKSEPSTNSSTQDDGLDSLSGYWMYRLQAVDQSGNHSNFSNERNIRISAPAVTVNPVERLEGEYRSKAKGIVLEWAHLTKKSVRYLVFRQKNTTEEPVLLAQINTTRFFDSEVIPGQQYNYFVIVQAADGSYSVPSEDLMISTQ